MAIQTPPPTISLDSGRLTSTEFEFELAEWMNWLPVFWHELAPSWQDMENAQANVLANSSAMANLKWVSGATYAIGDVRYSSIDFLNYRRKTAGAGTTDPSSDATNWELITNTSLGGASITSSGTSIVLTGTSQRLNVISMTAADLSVTLPSATGLKKGFPSYVFYNSGQYPFALRKNGGELICVIEPQKTTMLGCSDISTAPGSWVVVDREINKLLPVNTYETLNSVDSRFIDSANLTSTKAISCYKNNATGFIEAVILNYGSASGTPVAVTNEQVLSLTVASLSATVAVVIYQPSGSSNVKGHVLTVSGNSISVSAVSSLVTAAGSSYYGVTLSAISATDLLCVYVVSGTTTLKQRVLSVSGTTITAGAESTPDSTVIDTTAVNGKQFRAGKISATKMLVGFLSNAGSMVLRNQTISGTTATAAGTALTIASLNNATATVVESAEISVVVMSTSRAVALRISDRVYPVLTAYLIDISGTSPVLLSTRQKFIDINKVTAHVNAVKVDSNRIYASWGYGLSGIDSIIVSITSEDKILFSCVSENVMPFSTSGGEWSSCCLLDSTRVMQISRNSFNYLIAKTIEIAA